MALWLRAITKGACYQKKKTKGAYFLISIRASDWHGPTLVRVASYESLLHIEDIGLVYGNSLALMEVSIYSQN